MALAAVALLALGQYAPRISHEFVRLAGAMQCGDSTHGDADGVRHWSAPPLADGGINAPQPRGEEPEPRVTMVENEEAGTLASVIDVDRELATGEATGRIVLVMFRATVLPSNCPYNDDEHLVPYPNRTARGAHVHSGFFRAYNSLKERVVDEIRTVVSRGPVNMLVCTGWSIGGAMCNYLVAEVRALGYAFPVTFFGYGMPRVGDAAFAGFFGALPGVVSVNVWNRGDNVPQCGLFEPDGDAGCTQYERGFRHAVGTIVWYPGSLEIPPGAEVTQDGDEPPYVLCQEDSEACWPSNRALNGDDHLYYMGEMMTCCNPAPLTDPILPPAEGGEPVATAITAHCRYPFAAAGCNAEHLHEPTSAALDRGSLLGAAAATLARALPQRHAKWAKMSELHAAVDKVAKTLQPEKA